MQKEKEIMERIYLICLRVEKLKNERYMEIITAWERVSFNYNNFNREIDKMDMYGNDFSNQEILKGIEENLEIMISTIEEETHKMQYVFPDECFRFVDYSSLTIIAYTRLLEKVKIAKTDKILKLEEKLLSYMPSKEVFNNPVAMALEKLTNYLVHPKKIDPKDMYDWIMNNEYRVIKEFYEKISNLQDYYDRNYEISITYFAFRKMRLEITGDIWFRD